MPYLENNFCIFSLHDSHTMITIRCSYALYLIWSFHSSILSSTYALKQMVTTDSFFSNFISTLLDLEVCVSFKLHLFFLSHKTLIFLIYLNTNLTFSAFSAFISIYLNIFVHTMRHGSVLIWVSTFSTYGLLCLGRICSKTDHSLLASEFFSFCL